MSDPATQEATDRRDGAAPSAVSFVLAGRRARLAGVAATSFLGGMTEALFLVLITRAAFAITDGKDRVGVVAGRFVDTNQLLLLGLVLLMVRLAAAMSAAWLSTGLASQVIADVRARLSNAFLSASWERQQQQRSGSLQELLTTYSGQAGMIMVGVGGAVLAGANLAAFLALALLVDPTGAAVLVVSIAVLGLLLRPLRNMIRRRANQSQAAGMEFATALNEMSQLGLEVHVFHVQSAAQTRIEQLIEQARVVGARAGFANGIAAPAYTGIAYVALLGALVVASTTDSASLTSLGAVILVMLRSLSYGQALQSSYNNIAASTPAIEELQLQLASLTAAQRADHGLSIEKIGLIEAEHVSFGYVPGQGVLHDISFSIEPHEVVGIVGPSGGGKSTLVQLLLGLRDPDVGRIAADGFDIGSYSKEEWARKVTFVPQSAHLIAGSIADNIRFLREGVTDADVEMAARMAHLHDDVIGFPEGYARDVGEQGGHLSGGQQQRLCIARALVEAPELLILDEPTSALDVRSEHLVRTTLLGLKDRMTVVVIAHRLSTLDICDRIMVIQAGELKAFDSPTKLEETNAFYREALELSGLR